MNEVKFVIAIFLTVILSILCITIILYNMDVTLTYALFNVVPAAISVLLAIWTFLNNDEKY